MGDILYKKIYTSCNRACHPGDDNRDYYLGTLCLSHVIAIHFDGLVQDCSISIANALEILQSCTKPSIYRLSAHRFLLLVPELQMSCRHLTTWWCQQMKTFSSLLALCEGNLLVTSGFPSQRLVTQSVFFFIWTNVGVNKRDASDLRRHQAHYDVMVMTWLSARIEQQQCLPGNISDSKDPWIDIV